jgi:hypothetical protein
MTEEGQSRRRGLFGRFAARAVTVGTLFSVFDEIFTPAKHDAKIVAEAQQRAGKPAPSPADPPDLELDGLGHAGGRFSARIIMPPNVFPDRLVSPPDDG